MRAPLRPRPDEHTDQPSDELREVALRAGRGDAAALTELVRATSTTVWRACAALVDPASADDLAQDTYLRAVTSLPTYRGEANPTRWLLTIARRVCAEEIGARQRSRRLLAALESQRRVVSADFGFVSDVGDAVDRLPDERREAFLLTVVAGLPYADAAAMCGCPVGTIRSRVARARAELVDVLAEREVQNAAG
ncbi:sigma-70 family RNA polymerase sigma factor [uncultured Jatrophihabitans sp.]|uniref:sigma-70 family RNA polymerase sigma factor n=1 Tax=uncultured Jatrophihabitans sp. TaxID=1610747 RepID=UPI0035C9CE1B